LVFSLNFFAQDTNIYIIVGKIIDAEELKPVPMAYIINTNRRTAVQTDTTGKFRILMDRFDNLKVSCIGYYTESIKPNFKSADKNNKIEMVFYIKPQTYMIGKVDIYRLRWDAFIYDISQTELEEDEKTERITKWFAEIIDNEDLEKINVESGIRIPMPIYTHREKQLKKIKTQQKIDELNKIAEAKFNKELVAEITKLDGKELDDFMKYCSFERDFVIQTSEYDLIVIIMDIFKEYQKKQ